MLGLERVRCYGSMTQIYSRAPLWAIKIHSCRHKLALDDPCSVQELAYQWDAEGWNEGEEGDDPTNYRRGKQQMSEPH